MSQDLAHDKRIQAGLSLGGATLGLSALGTKGGAVVLRQAGKGGKVARAVRLSPAAIEKAPKMADAADKASLGLVTTASGVGGASGIHFARLQRKEAKKEEAVAKDVFGVSKSVVDMESKRAEAEARRLKAESQKRYRKDMEEGRFLRVDQEPRTYTVRDVFGRAREVDNPAASMRHRKQKVTKPKPKPVMLRRTSYSGHKPEDARQRRMAAEQYGLTGAAGGSAAAAGGFALVARSKRNEAKALGARADRGKNVIARRQSRVADATIKINEIDSRRHSYTPRTPKPLDIPYQPKPYRPGPKDPKAASKDPVEVRQYLENKRLHEAAQAQEYEKKRNPPVNPKKVERLKQQSLDRFNQRNRAQRDPLARTVSRQERRIAAVQERGIKLERAGRKAIRVSRGARRASIVAGGAALALGAGAAGVRHMRRNQGKEYRDWWDG